MLTLLYRKFFHENDILVSVKNVQMSKLVQRKVTSCNSCSVQQKYKIVF